MSEKALIALLNESGAFSQWIGDAVDYKLLALSDKYVCCAIASFHTALEHHGAILTLTRSRHSGSAMALLRPQFESFIRGVWLRRCASPPQFDQFLAGSDPPGMDKLLTAIESQEWYASQWLSRFKSVNWPVMCDFTHTGVRQIGRRFLNDEVTQNYSTEEQVELLMASNFFAALTAFEVADLLSDSALLQSVEYAYDLLPKRH